MMLGLILFLIFAFYFLSPANSDVSCCMNHQSHTHTVEDILNERYARGEIDREDYLERKQELSGQKQQISLNKG